MSAPIGNTCGDIDNAISILEDLRNDNSTLRGWGEEQETRVDELEGEVSDLTDQVNNLENEISRLNRIIDEA